MPRLTRGSVPAPARPPKTGSIAPKPASLPMPPGHSGISHNIEADAALVSSQWSVVSCDKPSALRRTTDHRQVTRSLHFFNLPVLQLQRSRATEDRRNDSHRALIRNHLVNLAFEVHERAVGHANLFTLLEVGACR